MRLLALGLLASLLSPETARGAEWFADLETGVLWAGSNDVRIPGDAGTRFSLVDDLDASQAPYHRVRLGATLAGRHTVFAFFTSVRLGARGTLDRDVRFLNATYPAGSAVSATYRFDSYRLTYRYALVRAERWEAEVGFTAKIRDAAIALQGEAYQRRANTGFVPLLSFRAAAKISRRLSIVLDGDALAAPQGRAEDVGLALELALRDGVAARAGYRLIEGGADNDSVYNFAFVHHLGLGLTVRL